jgi:hypothetical protein
MLWTFLRHVMNQPKTEFTPQEKALYEFMLFFAANEKEMLNKMVDWYPQVARDLEKGLSRTREMCKLLRG